MHGRSRSPRLGREWRFQNDQIACAMPELGMSMDGLPQFRSSERAARRSNDAGSIGLRPIAGQDAIEQDDIRGHRLQRLVALKSSYPGVRAAVTVARETARRTRAATISERSVIKRTNVFVYLAVGLTIASPRRYGPIGRRFLFCHRRRGRPVATTQQAVCFIPLYPPLAYPWNWID
jgi:hypothetical protein